MYIKLVLLVLIVICHTSYATNTTNSLIDPTCEYGLKKCNICCHPTCDTCNVCINMNNTNSTNGPNSTNITNTNNLCCGKNIIASNRTCDNTTAPCYIDSIDSCNEDNEDSDESSDSSSELWDILKYVIIGGGSLCIVAFFIYVCCCFGSKKPPVEYADIVNRFD